MSVLEPGIYVLTEAVENPLGDGRVRHDWREQKEIKAGTEFVVRDAAMPALEIDGAPFTRREIYLRRGYSHQSLYVDMKGESKRYPLLQALSERLQRKEDSRAKFDFWCADNCLEVSGTARELLYQAPRLIQLVLKPIKVDAPFEEGSSRTGGRTLSECERGRGGVRRGDGGKAMSSNAEELVNARRVLAEERARTDRLIAALMEVLSPHIASDGEKTDGVGSADARVERTANHTLDEWLQIVVNRLVDDRAQALDAVKQAEAEVGRLRDLGWERRALAAEELLVSKSADLDKVLAANERLSQNRDHWAKQSGEWEARAKSLEEELAKCEEHHAMAERKLVDAEAVARAVTLAEHKEVEERADGRDAMLVSSLRVKLAQMESALKEEKLMRRRAVGFYGILLGRLDTSATEEEVSRDIQRLTTICSEQSEKIGCLERELQELRMRGLSNAK